jgi:AcrR family transcriptional regulator
MKSTVAPTSRRPYRQQARAAAATENTRRVVAAAAQLFSERYYDEVTLDDVASRAGVGVQTLIRRFPTKEALVDGVIAELGGQIEAQRGAAPVGDLPGIVSNLADHYEATGDITLLVLAQEGRVPPFARATTLGRRVHREWVERVFADSLRRLTRANRERRIVQLVAICDVYVWKVMRRDQGLTRAQYERALREMINGLEKET